MALSRTDAAPCGPKLRKLLDSVESRQVAGNTPFLLDRSETCWWLERGRIEIFVVDLRDGEPQGARRHFATMESGTMMFGLEADDTGPALLAVPHVDTHVRCIGRDRLQELSGDSAGELAAPIDQWIRAVSDGLARWASPSPVIQHAVPADSVIRVPAHHRVGGANGIVWVELPRDTALFLGAQELPPGSGPCLLPLSPETWAQCGVALDVPGYDTVRLLCEGRLWDGLATLHDVLMPTAQLNQMLASVDEHHRLRQRTASAERDWQRGMGELRSVLDQRHAEEVRYGGGMLPLQLAMQAVGDVEGFEVRLPVRRTQASEAPVDLGEIVRASGLRSRRVVLEPGWERHDTQAMLGFAKDDGRPLAILPGIGKDLKVLDPVRGETVHGLQAVALLADTAYVFTAPLPFAALGWAALSRYTLRRGWGDLLTLIGTAIAGGLLGMAVPIASSYLIDTVIPGHDRNHLVQVGFILVVLGLATFIMSYIGGIAFSRFQARAGPALQAAIIDRLLRLPVGFFRNHSAGDLALRASAVTQIDQLVSGSAVNALLGSVFAVFSFGLMMYYDWRLGLWAALMTLVYSLLSLAFVWLQLRHERGLARLDGQLQSMALQLVTGIAKLRLSASEDRAFARWAGLFAPCRLLSVKAARYANLQAVLGALFGLLPLLVFFLILGHYRDPDHRDMLAVGGLAAFLSAFGNFNGSMTQMTQTLVSLLSVQPLLERAMPIMTATPEVSDDKDDPGTLSGAVEFSHLSFRYAEDGPLILDDVCLSARAGEFIAIVGASGCGKSTLIRLLLGFEQPEAGMVLLDGKDMQELDVLAVRRQMGVVLQNSRPMPGSLYENIIGISDGGLEEAWEAARMAGLAEDIQRMPMGMHTMVTEGGSLSGGQMQRLMIAQAVVCRPRILVMDEATSALDNRVQAVITDSLERLSVTRIVVAHRLSTVVKANRIYVMDAGRVVEEGNFEQLMQRNGHFARLAAAQMV